jgi:hypothetical protein
MRSNGTRGLDKIDPRPVRNRRQISDSLKRRRQQVAKPAALVLPRAVGERTQQR